MRTLCLADSHRLFIDGLKEILRQRKDWQVLGSAVTRLELNTLLRHKSPDMLIVDYLVSGQNPVEFIASIRSLYPDMRILVLTSDQGTKFFGRMLALGIHGYLMKNVTSQELLRSITKILEGELEITTQLFNFSDETGVYNPKLRQQNHNLTARELQVLQYIAQEFSNQEIGKLLHLSTGTIDTHRKNIISKLGVKNTVGLIKYAIYNNLID